MRKQNRRSVDTSKSLKVIIFASIILGIMYNINYKLKINNIKIKDIKH